MLLPVAIIVIIAFVIWALFMVFRKSTGKTEVNKHREVSGNEKKIIKPGS